MRSHWNISSAGLKGLTNVECNADTCQVSNQQALKSMLGLLCSKTAEQQGPTPSSLKFDNLSAILRVNPQRAPVSLARCLTPNDAHVINQVTPSSATVSGIRKKNSPSPG